MLAGKFAVVDGPAGGQQTFIFAVGYNGFSQSLGFQHGSAHHLFGLDASAVIGEADHIPCHTIQVGQFLTLLTAGDGAVGVDADFSVFADQLFLEAQILHTVGHRLQIGHGTDGGISAGCGSIGAGINGFFIRKARLTKMNMYINKTWNDQTIIQLNYGGVFV